MIKNYLKLALRNMSRQKMYTLINILGLAAGMAACIIILMFVRHEMSYEDFHENKDNIYRVSREWFNRDGESSLHLGHCAPPFAPLIKEDFGGEVHEAIRVLRSSSLIIYDNKRFEENDFFFAENGFFDVFTYTFLQGDPETALAEPNTIVLTETAAKKYFGSKNPIGKTLNYENQAELKVTAVMQDVPSNSHIHFDMLASFETVENYFGRENMMQNWGSNNYATYLLLSDNYDATQLEARFPDFLNKHLEEYDAYKPSQYNQLHLWSIKDIHLYSHLDSEVEANGDITYVYIFSIIAFLILLIACINFINLSTAKATKRAKEVGMRKVLGAFRSSIIRQFMAESILIAVFAIGLGVLFARFLMIHLNDYIFVENPLVFTFGQSAFLISLLVGLALLVGILAGSYPALYLSSFSPLQILQGKREKGPKTSTLRSFLVVFQFTISIALIMGVLVIQEQLDYVRNKPLGFNKENVLTLPLSDNIYESYPQVRQELLNHPGITDVSMASRVPSGRLLDSQGSKAEVDGEMKTIGVRIADIHVDHNYLESFEVPFAAGRNFDINRPSDSAEAFILNEAAVKAIGWESAEAAIDKKFDYGNRQGGRIVGVVKDFHFENLQQEIAPIVFMVTQGRASLMVVRMHEGAQEQVLSFLEGQWAELRPDYDFSYSFIDESFSSQYGDQERLGRLIVYFSILSVIIAALGLFGLAAHTAEQRFKEIGIRKVLGASASQIWLLLTSRFSLLVAIALPFGALIGFFAMRSWLGTFAYQTSIKFWVVLLAGGLALMIAWITVSFQALKAANVNPVDAISES